MEHTDDALILKESQNDPHYCEDQKSPLSLQRKRRNSGSRGKESSGSSEDFQFNQTRPKPITGTTREVEDTCGKTVAEISDGDVLKKRKVTGPPYTQTLEDNIRYQSTMEKDCSTKEIQDKSYFSAYADIGIHEDMLADTVRTNAYRLAILRCWEQIRGKVVVDVGAGTGILSFFCVQAGAKKVYAIEASVLAEETRKVVKSNGMEGRIEVVRGQAEEVELPEKVDVVVSEWMNGLMLPSEATIYLAPITDLEVEDRLQFWDNIGAKYQVDMSALKPYVHKCITRKVQVKPVQMEDILATPNKVMTLDLGKVSVDDLSCVQGAFNFRCYGWSQLHGFATWFDVEFPSPKPVLLSTSPYSEDTHWMQSVMYLDEPVQVTQDTKVNGTITITPNTRNSRFLDMTLKYSVDDREEVERLYPMDDCV